MGNTIGLVALCIVYFLAGCFWAGRKREDELTVQLADDVTDTERCAIIQSIEDISNAVIGVY